MHSRDNARLKVLAIHSYATHGMASMKVLHQILGNSLLPVPSLVLSGLTNIPGHVKMDIDFEKLLMSSLEICRNQGQMVLLYIGYLGNADQIKIILHAIEKYGHIIQQVLVDPVSGDHGKIYVPNEIIDSWPELLSQADWAFPNFTELKLYAAYDIESKEDTDTYFAAFQGRFPKLNLIATSIPKEDRLGIYIRSTTLTMDFLHPLLPIRYGGTGDVFAGLIVKHHFLEMMELGDSVLAASEKCLGIIQDSFVQHSEELIIPTFLQK